MLKGKISIPQILSPPFQGFPSSAATHPKYNSKRIKTVWLSHLQPCSLCCLAPGHHSCHLHSTGTVISSAPLCTAVLSMWPGQAGRTNHHVGPATQSSLKTFYRLNSILFFILLLIFRHQLRFMLRSNLKLNVWCQHQKRIVLALRPRWFLSQP